MEAPLAQRRKLGGHPLPLRGADGEYRWFLSRAFPIRDGNGRITRWFGTNTDVTEQRKAAEDLKLAKEQIEAASRAKDDFLAALSHELRTPLTPVLMTATTLREDKRLPEETRESLAMMERNISLEARLIDDLLDLTAISRGKLRLHLEPCDAHPLIDLAVEIVNPEARAKGITIQKAYAARFSGLIVDPARFQQVIWNLLRNSRQNSLPRAEKYPSPPATEKSKARGGCALRSATQALASTRRCSIAFSALRPRRPEWRSAIRRFGSWTLDRPRSCQAT